MRQRTSAPAETVPYWTESSSLPRFPKVSRSGHVDVLVVGGGITGLTAAYLLVNAGKNVALIERARCARVDTAHTTAHLTMVTDARLADLVSRFGRDHAQAAWDAGLAAISQIHSIVRTEQIDCGFEWVDGYLHAPVADADPDQVVALEEEFEEEAALATELGFDAEFIRRVPAIDRPGVRFDSQARFHPGRYIAGLVRAIAAAGGSIYEGAPVDEFLTDRMGVKVNGHTLSCDDVILATHNPLAGVSGLVGATAFQTKLALYTSYVVAGGAPRGRIPDALYWDTASPYHYLRIEPQQDRDLVIFGGEDHKTGQADDTNECYERLEQTLTSLVPDVEITHRWSGQVIETPDGLPYIGLTADHQYAATGFAGNGMTFGTLGAMIACDGILGVVNPWADLFEPGRKAVMRGAWRYIRENADYPYYLIRDRFAGAEGKSLRAVKRGQGRIIEQNGAKVAAFRDDSGATTLLSASCTHMGCIVRWNQAESTWDCPCHGSRFKPGGDVISGPAETPLEKLM